MDKKVISIEFCIKEGKSKKGNDYALAEFIFENGYKFSAFLTDEQKFILSQI